MILENLLCFLQADYVQEYHVMSLIMAYSSHLIMTYMSHVSYNDIHESCYNEIHESCLLQADYVQEYHEYMQHQHICFIKYMAQSGRDPPASSDLRPHAAAAVDEAATRGRGPGLGVHFLCACVYACVCVRACMHVYVCVCAFL